MTQDGEQSVGDIVIENPKGFPDTIAGDLTRADGRWAEACQLNYDEGRDVVTAYWPHDNAGKWLHGWLEQTMQYYKTEYVNASGEYRAARQIRDAVCEAMKG